MTSTIQSEIVVRTARSADAATLERLAALDSARPLQGSILLAEIDGQTRAAIAVDNGRVVADPFVPTSDAVALLELRATRLDATSAHKRRGLRRPRATRTLARLA